MTIDKQLEEIEAAIAKLEAKRIAVQRRRMLKCHHCGRRTAVRNLTYIQMLEYVAPYGCTGGDYWDYGEGRYVCPKCGETNRLIDLHGHEDTPNYKKFFKDMERVNARWRI